MVTDLVTGDNAIGQGSLSGLPNEVPLRRAACFSCKQLQQEESILRNCALSSLLACLSLETHGCLSLSLYFFQSDSRSRRISERDSHAVHHLVRVVLQTLMDERLL